MKARLTDLDFFSAAAALGCEVAAIKAVCEVEAPRGGFFPDDSPTILFEGHVFYRYTSGFWAESAPDLCYRKWTREHYGKTWVEEKARFATAATLDRKAAVLATSWGRFQIMGFNSGIVGFSDEEKFVEAMSESEGKQLAAFIEYILYVGLEGALGARDWEQFARRYNGPLHWKNHYAERMAKAYARFSS